MQISQMTPEWLQKQSFDMHKEMTIEGVYVKDLTTHMDGRGDVTELWSQSWVDDNNVVTPKHVYQSATDYGVVKCWHLHEKHTDQFTVTRGKLQVSLVDLREDSPTFLHVNCVFLGTSRPKFVKIPPGIMHGWKALSFPEVIVVNFQTEVFDVSDEFRFDWNCVLEHIWEPING
jgi:dTDP-4-dehydrorhamnose 3,5-epimerase